MFFSSWQSLERVLIVGILAYVGLVLLLRISGKRTLSKMNAFDLIVTVALGSTLATMLLSKDVGLTDGLLAFGTLIGLQFVITWLSVRWPAFSRLVKADPALLYHRGRFLTQTMRRERVVKAEVRAAVRAQGIPEMAQVGAVILETDGSFTVLHRTDSGSADVLDNMAGASEETNK